MQRALVVGGAGFLGSHLVEALLRRDVRVTVVDNLITGSRENLQGLDVDLHIADAAQDALPTGRFDAVFHLGSPAAPRAYQAHALDTLYAGSHATRRLLELSETCGARFLLASTSEVYGDPEVHPQPEEYWGRVNPIGPRSMYDEAKRFAEALTVHFGRERGVETRIARIFNSYGPRVQVDDGRVVTTFLVQALRGEPLTVHGSGAQTRSYCFVDDTVAGLLEVFEGGDHRPFNVGHPDETTILALAERVHALLGDTGLRFVDRPPEDPARRCPQLDRITRQTGWRPRIDLDTGLGLTAAWLQTVVPEG